MPESLYQTILDSAGDAVIIVDPEDNRVLHANRWAEKLTGLGANDSIDPAPSSSPGGPVVIPSLGWLCNVIQEARNRRRSRTCVIWQPPGDSRRQSRCLEVFATRMDEGASSVAVLIRTLYSDKMIENKLWQRNRELQLLNRANCEIGRSLNPDEVLAMALDFSLELFGYTTGIAYLRDRNDGALNPVVMKGAPQTASFDRLGIDEGFGAVKASLSAVPVFSTSPEDLAKYQLKSFLSTTSIPLQTGDCVLGVLEVAANEDGTATRYDLDLLTSFGFQVGIALDNALLHQEMEAASHIDGLTEIYTRQRLELLLEDRVSIGRRYGEPFAALMIDIDRFKAVNDLYGHDVGDGVLKAVVDCLGNEIRESDSLGRWGGEEFVIILPKTGLDEAMALSERVRSSILAMNFEDVAGIELPVTICVGVASFPDHAGSADGLIRCADEAMRYAKRAGRNRTQCYSGKMKSSVAMAHHHRIALDESTQTIRALAAALDAKDSYTANHSEAVRSLAVKLARQMGIEAERIEVLEWAALLHDIGKVAIPDSVLNKPGRLDENEWAIIQEHPRMGVLIIKEAPRLLPTIPVVLHHHENFNGSGYPEGRAGERIPLLARILRVADIFMAMISARPYRKPFTPQVAMQEIKKGSGTMFDPQIVEALCAVVTADEAELLKLA